MKSTLSTLQPLDRAAVAPCPVFVGGADPRSPLNPSAARSGLHRASTAAHHLPQGEIIGRIPLVEVSRYSAADLAETAELWSALPRSDGARAARSPDIGIHRASEATADVDFEAAVDAQAPAGLRRPSKATESAARAPASVGVAASASAATDSDPPANLAKDKVASATDAPWPVIGWVGRFALKERLGEDALGNLYRAWDPERGIEIALKSLRPLAGSSALPDPSSAAQPTVDLTEMDDPAQRIGAPASPTAPTAHQAAQQAQQHAWSARQPQPHRLAALQAQLHRLAALNHASIPAWLEVGEAGPGPYVVQEALPGVTLAENLRAGWRPTPATALRLVQQMASALTHAHERGAVHGAISLHNVLLLQPDMPVLADFGLLQAIASSDAAGADAPALADPQAPARPGQPLFAAPAGAQADTDALGLILYALLAGTAPGEAEESGPGTAPSSASTKVSAHLALVGGHGTPTEPSPSALAVGDTRVAASTATATATATTAANANAMPTAAAAGPTLPSLLVVQPHLPPMLCEMVERMLDPAPQRRPQSAAQAARWLRQIEQPTLDAQGTHMWIDQDHPAAPHRRYWIAALVLLCGLAAGAAAFNLRRTLEPPAFTAFTEIPAAPAPRAPSVTPPRTSTPPAPPSRAAAEQLAPGAAKTQPATSGRTSATEPATLSATAPLSPKTPTSSAPLITGLGDAPGALTSSFGGSNAVAPAAAVATAAAPAALPEKLIQLRMDR